MNIDDLVNSITEDELRSNLARWIDDWKSNETDIHELYNLVSKWHGNSWFKDQTESNEFYKNLQSFKTQAIEGIGGLTMNERLYWFGLFDKWDSADSNEQQRIRNKLNACA